MVGKIFILTILMAVSYTRARPDWKGNPDHLLSENDYIDENSGRYQGNAGHLLSENDYIDETPKKSRHQRMVSVSDTTAPPNWEGNLHHLLSENDYIDENSGRYQGNAGHLPSENDYIDENPKKSRHQRMVSVSDATAPPNWEGNLHHLLSENDYINENLGRYQGNTGHLLSENDYIHENSMKLRNRREVQTNADGTKDINVKYPLAAGEKNVLSALADVTGVNTDDNSFKSVSGGLEIENINGHELSLTGKHIPNVGNELTAAGKVQILNKDHHDLSANAFVTRDMPSNPDKPSTNTFGGGLDYIFNKHRLSLSGKHTPEGNNVAATGKMEILHDKHHDLTATAFATRSMPTNPASPISDTFGGGLAYTFKDKIGASLDVLHTPLRQQTDLSAMSHFNLYRNPTTTLDFNAGVSKSFSPFMPRSSWQPYGGLSFTKYF